MDLTGASTLVIMPHKEQWDQFIEIKKMHMNPKIKRPPYPHITLLQPFYKPEKFDEVEERIESILKDMKPFKCVIKEFKMFENKKSQTLYLDPVTEPPNALQDIYDILAKEFPECVKGKFKEHIGVGFFKNLNQAKMLGGKYQEEWKPIEFMVKEVYINYRTSDISPFLPRRVIPIGYPSPPYNKPVPL